MSDKQFDPEKVLQTFARLHDLNQEMAILESEGSQEARDRSLELIDEMMTLDMSLQPFRKRMGQASTGSATGGNNQGDSGNAT